MKDKQNYLASLKSQLASVQAQAAADAQAQAQAEAQAKADAQAAQEAEIQRAYAAALTTYQNETLPQYQKELGELNAAYIKAQSEYNPVSYTHLDVYKRQGRTLLQSRKSQ